MSSGTSDAHPLEPDRLVRCRPAKRLPLEDVFHRLLDVYMSVAPPDVVRLAPRGQHLVDAFLVDRGMALAAALDPSDDFAVPRIDVAAPGVASVAALPGSFGV